MKKTLDFFLYSNIFVALCASALTLYTYKLLVLQNNKWSITLFVFFSTILAYNFQRFNKKGTFQLHSYRIKWSIKNKKLVLLVTAISFLAVVSLFVMLPTFLIILLIPLMIICIWYAIDLLKNYRRNIPLREVPLLKIFLIAFVWIGACFILPVVSQYGYPVLMDFQIQLLALAFGCYIFSVTLPFDIRDLQDDKELNLLTFPSKIGIYKTKLLSYIGFIIAVIVFYYLYSNNFIGTAPFLAFVASVLVTVVLVSFASIRRKDLYYSLVLESCLLLPFALTEFLQLLN